MLGWSQQELADRAIVALTTVRRVETGAVDPRASSLDSLVKALESAGITFHNRGGEGVMLTTTKSDKSTPTRPT